MSQLITRLGVVTNAASTPWGDSSVKTTTVQKQPAYETLALLSPAGGIAAATLPERVDVSNEDLTLCDLRSVTTSHVGLHQVDQL